MTTEITKTRPAYRIFAVTKNGDSKFWQPIGALWANKDGKGFQLKLDYLPLNGAELVAREPRDDNKADGKGGAQ